MDTEGLTVVTGTLADIDTLRPLWGQMVEQHRSVMGDQFPVRTFEDSWPFARAEYAEWLAAGTALLLLAKADDVPVGYLLCRLSTSGAIFDLGSLRGDVDAVVVSDQNRGAGLGTRLLETCRAELLARGCTFWTIGVVPTNPGAERLYERLGFRPWIHEMAARLS